MSSRMRSGSSVRGLSLVTMATSARSAAMRPISGRLPRSRSPPQPNTTINRPVREGSHRVDRALERIGGVRVVAQHGRPRVDDLQPARAPAASCRAAPRSSRGATPSAHAHAAAASALATLKSPISGSATSCGAPSNTSAKRLPSRRAAHVGRVHVGGARRPEAHRARRPRQRLPRGIVGVDHGDAVRRELLDEQRLGREVRLHRAVIVEMIAREVREHRRLEREPFDASLMQRVRRRLHRHGAHAAIVQRAQHALQLDRARAS